MRTARCAGIFVATAAWWAAGTAGLVGAANALVACDQDSAASAPERDTHMGEIRAAPEPSGTIGTSAVMSAAVSAAPPLSTPPIGGAVDALPSAASTSPRGGNGPGATSRPAAAGDKPLRAAPAAAPSSKTAP
jgi:hypothetical protein